MSHRDYTYQVSGLVIPKNYILDLFYKSKKICNELLKEEVIENKEEIKDLEMYEVEDILQEKGMWFYGNTYQIDICNMKDENDYFENISGSEQDCYVLPSKIQPSIFANGYNTLEDFQNEIKNEFKEIFGFDLPLELEENIGLINIYVFDC